MPYINNNPSSISLHLVGLLSAVFYGYLAHLGDDANFSSMILPLLAAACLQFGLWCHLYRNDKQPIFLAILFWAIVFRAIGVNGTPLLEDDFYRYLWDGYQLIEHGTPYGIAPNAFFDMSFDMADTSLNSKLEQLLDNINHPHIATIYGPLCQWLFGLSYLIAPAEIWPLQLIFALFDIGIIVLLINITKARNVLLYAWCPLVIKEFAFTAHTDVMAIFFVLAACLAMLRNNNKIMALCLALAIGSKIFALLFIPILLVKTTKRKTPDKQSLALFCLTLAVLYLPFIGDIFGGQHGLTAMASGWIFNAPLYYLLPSHASLVKIILGSVFIIGWLIYWRDWLNNNKRLLPRGDLIFGIFLFIMPVINPWYWVWVLPFACIYFSLWAWVTSVAILLAYAIGINLNNSELVGYQQASWALYLEYSLIGLAAVASYYFSARDRYPKDSKPDEE